MVLGWTFCFPAGILFARFSSSFKDIGFPAHRILQSLGTVLVIAGFITAVVFTEDKELGEWTGLQRSGADSRGNQGEEGRFEPVGLSTRKMWLVEICYYDCMHLAQVSLTAAAAAAVWRLRTKATWGRLACLTDITSSSILESLMPQLASLTPPSLLPRLSA